MKRLHLQFGVAVVAAPAFILLYNFIFYSAWLRVLERVDIYLLFLSMMAYPVIEELVFRGLIQEYIATLYQKHFVVISAANLITSFLFVMLHLAYHQNFYVMLVFFPSLVFGYFKERYGTVLAPIALHMFYNLCGFFTVKPLF